MTTFAQPTLHAPTMRPLDDRAPIDPTKLRALREAKLSQVLGILRVLGLRTKDLPKLLPDTAQF